MMLIVCVLVDVVVVDAVLLKLGVVLAVDW